MLHIEIDVPRPRLTAALGLCLLAALWFHGSATPALGGNPATATVVSAEEDIRQLRLRQQVLSRREDILRTDLAVLLELEDATDDPVRLQEILRTKRSLLQLLSDKRAAEQEILTHLEQIWEVQGYARMASQTRSGSDDVAFVWPVDPLLGISAHFEDSTYEKRFGMPHHAIDIPVNQGSPVYAAADGIVERVSDKGMGFNSLIIRHDGGFATLYGHVSEFLVREGEHVAAGDIVARSGGQPGTLGAGVMTTGAHLHFELLRDGEHQDPEDYLPRYPGID